jgi:hypothetical protein
MAALNLVARLAAICARVDFDVARLEPFLIQRLRLLEEYSPTVEDAERMAEQAFALFRYYEQQLPARVFDADEKRVVILGCLFSDVGKTGPLGASPDTQRLVARMFSVEGVEDDGQTVRKFLRTHFTADADAYLLRFEALELDPEMSIRTFWNLHSKWTLEILQHTRIPREAVVAAATHHLLEDINPQQVVGDDGRFTQPFGENTAFDRAEKLVIVLDKYDAARRRGRLDHAGAIEWLRAHVQRHPKFGEDAELAMLISDVERLGQSDDGRAAFG